MIQTLLIVDDQPETLMVLSHLLEPHFRILVADSGERALKLADSSPRPDLILLDIVMPNMDGYTVLQQLRTVATTRDIPVIFITVRDDVMDEARGLELGVNDYISKPIKPTVVLARVRTQLENKLARDMLRNQLEQLDVVYTYSREGIMITSTDGCIISVNEAFTRITGYSRDEIIGQNPRILSSGRHSPEFYRTMWDTLSKQGYWSGAIWDRRKDGEVYAKQVSIIAIYDVAGVSQRYVALFSDITTQEEFQSQLDHVSHHDVLTNLPNRTLLGDRLRQAVAQSHQHQQALAVACIDLDNFKTINDTHGHAIGDHLLIIASERMSQCLHESDTLARLGGDEFVIVLNDLTNLQSIALWMQRLLTEVSAPMVIHDIQIQVSCSIGLTFHELMDNRDADQLLREADQAMYQAKLLGKNRYFVFDMEQQQEVRSHYNFVERIRQGLAQQEFLLYYQPKVNMKTGRVLGAEALIRWQHPERGLLAPGLFLPEIELDPVSIELGEWVIDTALKQIDAWQAQGLVLTVSVNIAPIHLQQTDFVERLNILLSRHPFVPASSLELEILETGALADIDHVSTLIKSCNNTLGVCFAMDDFGTGYSSLAYLKRLPAATLKIDQSFVRDMLYNPDDLAILEGVLGMATAFRRHAIAEGVETELHGCELLALGCELGQGYGIAKPMSAAEFPAWASAWQSPDSWKNRSVFARDNLPVLYAKVELRAFIKAVAAYLKTVSEAPKPDQLSRKFSVWLANSGRNHYGQHASFQLIEQVYSEMLDYGRALIYMKAQGQAVAALNGLTDLQGLLDRLLELLDSLAA